MRKLSLKIVLWGLFILFTNHVHAQWTYYQFFEPNASFTDTVEYSVDSASAKTWKIGKPNKVKFNSAFSNPNALFTDTSIYYDTSINASIIFKVHNATWGWSNLIAIRWLQKIDLEANNDFAFVYLSRGNSNVWYNAFEYSPNFNYNFYGFNSENVGVDSSNLEKGFTGTDTTWRDIWLCILDNNSFDSVINLKFVFKSDTLKTNHEGWMIDNFQFHPIVLHTVGSEIKSKDKFVVFPNTTNGVVHVESTFDDENKLINSIAVYDAYGKLLEQNIGVSKRVTIDLSKYPDGVYYLRPNTKDKSDYLKVILNH
jgi:Secretion system C-terminal sorting domain